MGSKTQRRARGARRLTFALATLFAVSSHPALAQESPRPISDEFIFSIPAQTLARALREFSLQTRIQLAVSSADVQGLTSTPTIGRFAPQAALELLLDGTGLVARQTGGQSYAILPVSDQDQSDPAGRRGDRLLIEEVVVTTSVTKTASLREVPQSVSIVNTEFLENQNVIAVEEALRYVPSVQAEISGRVGFDDYFVRGFSQSRYQFRDALRLDPGFLQQQEPFGLEQIEVLRGPASVLYGQIAPGGVVNSVSKSAYPAAPGQIGLTLGNFGLLRAFVDVSTALDTENKVAVRVPVVYQERDDQQDSVNSDRLFAAPSLSYALSERTYVVLRTLYQRDDYDRTIGLPFEGTLTPGPAGRLGRSIYLGEPGIEQLTSEQWQLGFSIEHQFTDYVAFTSNLRYSDFQLDGPIVQAPRPGSTATLINRRGFVFGADRSMLAADNRFDVSFGSDLIEHHVLLGLDYQHYEDANGGDLFALDPISLPNPSYGARPQPLGPFFAFDNELTQAGLYGQYQLTYADKWVGSLGLRFSDSENITRDVLSGTQRKQADDEVTVSAGLLYLSESGFSPYLSYSQSFEPQVGFDPLPSGETPDPSQGEQFEAGLRWESNQGDLRAQLAVFQLEQTNIVNGDPSNPGFSVLVGEQRHRGIELEVTGNISKSLELRAGYAYLDAEITRSNNGDEGQQPLTVPEHAASALATLSGAALGIPDAYFSLGLRFVGERRANAAGDTLDSFTLLDAAIRYDMKSAELLLNAKNLLDEEYFTEGNRFAVFGPARSIEFTVRRRF